MKLLILLFYSVSVLLIIAALFGGSLTESIIEEVSMKAIKTIGIDKSKIDSLDSQIDMSFYNMNLFIYRLERLKNYLTFGDDEQKPIELKRHNYISDIVYEPILTAVSYAVRGIMFTCGLVLLLIIAIIHTITSYFNLRKRVKILEERVLTNNQGIYEK